MFCQKRTRFGRHARRSVGSVAAAALLAATTLVGGLTRDVALGAEPAAAAVPLTARLAALPCSPTGPTAVDDALAAALNSQLTNKMRGFMNAYNTSCARAVVNAVRTRNLNPRAAAIAIATVIVESSIANLDSGDLDSVGLFQQRASWGSFAERTNPVVATNKFLDEMMRLYPNGSWNNAPIGDVAADVQRPLASLRYRYGVEANDGIRIANALWPTAYALSPARNGVFRWDGAGTGWAQIGGPATQLYGGGAGLFATNPVSGDLYGYTGTPNNWVRIGGPGHSFVVTSEGVYGLTTGKNGVFRWNGPGTTTWTQIGGPADQIFGGGAGLFAVNPTSKDLYRWNGTPNSWTRIGGPGHTFAVTAEGIYGLTTDRQAVLRWNGSGDSWTTVGGPADLLYGGGQGLFAVNPTSKDLYRFNGTPHNWTRVGGPGQSFAVASNTVYGLTPGGTGVFRWNGAGDSWTQIGGPAAAIATTR